MPLAPLWLVPLFLLGAALYASVGHGGATVYLAILVLAGYAPGPVGTTVLVLNIVAAGLAFVQFRQAGHLRIHLLWPFLLTSVPAAYFGGRLRLDDAATQGLLAFALLAAALRFLLVPSPPEGRLPADRRLFLGAALALGASLGFLAGATGIGGGIFLSPILVLLGWASVKEAGSVASGFIVVNSLAGLVGRLPRYPLETDLLAPLLVAVLIGAGVGSYVGARRVAPRALQVLLAVVLLVAVGRIAVSLLG